MQYFSRSFTMEHIVPYIELPANIQVFCNNMEVAKVKMVMAKSNTRGKLKCGGAMITSKWMEVVNKFDMRAGDIFVFWFRGSSAGLKLLINRL